jgi:hypothetical protein
MLPLTSVVLVILGQRRTLLMHDVPIGRQQNNNETIAFFRDNWDVFTLH